MARRLNKKVALIGSAVFMFFAVVAVAVILHMSRSPEKYIADGNAALEANDYKLAERSFLRAKSRAKDDALRLELLDTIIEIFLTTEQWPQVRGSWQEVIRLDPENIPVRYAQLKYYYIVSDSGSARLFGEVESQATELLEIIERNNLLDEQVEQWETPTMKKVGIEHTSLTAPGQPQRIGPYLYILRGRAKYEQARIGGVVDRAKMLEEAIADLHKALELDPASVAAAWYDAQAILLRGQILASQGMLDQRERALKEALEIISQAVEKAPNDPQGHIYKLLLKQQVEAAASTEDLVEDWMEKLEPSYLELIKKFPNEARVYAILSNLYRAMGPKYLDKAVDAIEKAKELEPQNIGYSFNLADMRYLKFSLDKNRADLEKALKILNESIESPSVQETSGPKQIRNINNRATLYILLSTIYAEQLILDGIFENDLQKQLWENELETSVRQIEQILQSGEDPIVIKWQGMLALVRGNRPEGLRKLYTAYQQLKAANRIDTHLAYMLAKSFENTAELGAANEFWTAALRLRPEDRNKREDSIDKRKPDAWLDCAELWSKFRSPPSVLNLVGYYETFYGVNKRSQILRISAHIEGNELDKALSEIQEAKLDEPNGIVLNMALLQRRIRNSTIALQRERLEAGSEDLISTEDDKTEKVDPVKLQDQLDKDYSQLYQLVQKLLKLQPDEVKESAVVLVCNYYRKEGDKEKAKILANAYLEHSPNNLSLKMMLGVLEAGSEPDEESVAEVQKNILKQIDDPEVRALNLGIFYSGKNEPNEAIRQFRVILDPHLKDLTSKRKSSEHVIMASARLFDELIKNQDYKLAEQVSEFARVHDVDNCQGNYFKARLELARNNYDRAMQYIDRAIDLRPVFSEGYALKARVYSAQGKNELALQNIRTAIQLNPLDGNSNKFAAFMLYERNEKLGANVTADQKIEFAQALQNAMHFNPNDIALLGFYADYLAETEPEKALAMRQRIYVSQPTVANAVQLGNLASKAAQNATDSKRKEAFFDIAENAFIEALKIDPQNNAALYSYTEYQRSRGQHGRAEKLLEQADDKRLLGQHYFDTGQYDKAKEIFEEIYQQESDNIFAIRALLVIAQRTQNQQDTIIYSEKLVAADNNIEHNLMQIQSYLAIGLVREAELKLESFQERYPNEPRALLLEAWVYMSKGQLNKALDLANRSIELDESNPVSWRLKGQINRFLANYNQAILDLSKSKSLEDQVETRMELARAYMSVQRHQDAALELAAIMDDISTPLQARELLEQIYYSMGNVDALRRFYNSMIKMFPDDLRWLNKAGGFVAQLKDYGTALTLYKQALDKSVQAGQINSTALEGYLNAFLNQDKLDQVISEGSKYIDSPLATIALTQMAQAKVKMNDRQTAIGYMQRAVDAAGQNQNLAATALRIMYDIFGPEEVKKYSNQRLEKNPNDMAANYALYQLARIERDYNKAVSYLDKIAEIVGPQSEAGRQYRSDKASLLFTAFELYSDNSYLDRSIELWQELLKEMPDNIFILNNLAYVLGYADIQLTKALEMAEKAVLQGPDNPGLLDTYAYVLYKNGRYKEAEEQAQAAVQQYELKQNMAPAEAYEHLGMIKEKLGKSDEAIVFYNKALESGQRRYSQDKIKQIQAAVDRLSN
ncbi:MAG: tetratricopeptide repeat protein [Phycisphaerae bacterium]